MLVVDCSIAIAWLMPDEGPSSARSVLDLVARDGAVAPAHWPLEVTNTLLVAERRGRLTGAQRSTIVRHISSLPIVIDDETAERAWTRTLDLADRYGLTAYDAAYLELAERRSLAVGTLDRALGAAATGHGIEVLPPHA